MQRHSCRTSWEQNKTGGFLNHYFCLNKETPLCLMARGAGSSGIHRNSFLQCMLEEKQQTETQQRVGTMVLCFVEQRSLSWRICWWLLYPGICVYSHIHRNNILISYIVNGYNIHKQYTLLMVITIMHHLFVCIFPRLLQWYPSLLLFLYPQLQGILLFQLSLKQNIRELDV